MKHHGDILLDLIRERSIKIMAEVGVYRSKLTKFLLKNSDKGIDEYWAIDPWDPRNHQFTVDNLFWSNAYKKTLNLMPWFLQLKVIRMTSVSASKLFPNSYFDLVFIDGNHLYEDVKRDIGSWLPKVKSGGILAGHDYNLDEHKHRYTDVKEVVDEVFGFENIEIVEDHISKTYVWIYYKE